MTVEQHEARLAAIKAAFDTSTEELENVQREGQSVPRATSSTFSQPKPTFPNAFVRPTNKTTSFPPSRPAKRPSNIIDMDSSDDESSGGVRAFSQPKPTIPNSFARPINKTASSAPSRPAKRPSNPIDTDGSDDESSGGVLPPRKYRKTSNGQTAGDTTKPWDQDHSKMKKPPRISLSGPRGEPQGMSSSGKTKRKASRVSIQAQIELSVEQRGILELVLQGQSVFFTGSAGKATEWEPLRTSDLFHRHWQVRIT
jgi:hypothetical protein